MKKNTVFILITLLLATGLAQAKDLDVSLDLTSRYIWRGYDILNSKAAIQPSITYNIKDTGFAVNLWCSFALQDRNIYKYSDEIDLTLSYTFSPTEDISFSMGFIHYGYYFAKNFKFKDNTTQEVYLTTTFTSVPLSPYISVYYDFNTGSGFYFIGGVSHSIEVAEGYNLDLSSSIAYNSKHSIDKSGMSDFTAGASMGFKLGSVTITPYLKYSRIFMREINPSKNEVWFGGIISF